MIHKPRKDHEEEPTQMDCTIGEVWGHPSLTPGSVAQQLLSAAGFFTRLPLQAISFTPVRLKDCVWAFPLVGAFIGLFASLVVWLVSSFYGGAMGVAFCALGVVVFLTGALHEDALADFADGLGAHNGERALEVMRDSALGTFGAIALWFSLFGRVIAMSSLQSSFYLIGALIGIEALSRSVLPCLMMMNSVHEDGLSHGAGRPEGRFVLLSLLFGFVIASLSLSLAFGFGLMVIALIITGGVWLYCARKFGGISGDMIGTCEQLVKLACYGILALLMSL